MQPRSEQAKAIFEQLHREPGEGGVSVRCVIENHDAWINGVAVYMEIDASLRERLRHDARTNPVLSARIERQRQALATLVTPVARRTSAAS